MIEVKVRIYRSHDYDLMALAQTGVISIAVAAKDALEACFTGEECHIYQRKPTRAIPSSLGNSLCTRLYLSDEEYPGIESWFKGFESGMRNNFIKCLIRRGLGQVPVWAYRTDDWKPPAAAHTEVKRLDSDFSEAGAKRERSKRRKPQQSTDKQRNDALSAQQPSQVDAVKLPAPSSTDIQADIPEPEMVSHNPSNTYLHDANRNEESLEVSDSDFDILGAFDALHK